MAETCAEAYVRDLFARLYGLRLRKLAESRLHRQKTVDFELLHEDGRAAVVEVKNLERTPRLPEYGWRDETPAGWPAAIRSFSRDDNAPSRICALIHTGYQQLASYPDPKVLVFVNDEHLADIGDLEEAVTGVMVYENDEVTLINGVTSRRREHQRIIDEALKIDLYVWAERHTAKGEPLFRFGTSLGQRLAVRLFGCPALPIDLS